MNGRQYRCQATNASGTTYSATVTLTVKKGPDYVPPALKPITERVIHLPAPKTGGKMYYVFPQENDQYGAIFSWNRSVDPEEGFEPGLDYVLYLDLSAKNGYTLDGLTPDFFLVPGAEKVELSEEFGRPRLTITWPITSGERSTISLRIPWGTSRRITTAPSVFRLTAPPPGPPYPDHQARPKLCGQVRRLFLWV